MEQLLGQILVLVANIHPGVMNAEVEKGFMSTTVEHELIGSKRVLNQVGWWQPYLFQSCIILIFLNYMLWC